MITRRQILVSLATAGAASAWLAVEPLQAQTPPKHLPNFGGAPAGFPVRTRAGRGGAKPFDFVEHCHSLGLGVVETRLHEYRSRSHQGAPSEGGRPQYAPHPRRGLSAG